MQLGMAAINHGNAKLANQEFTLAIKKDLKNPALHAANALAYQMRVRAGDRGLFELAETGYLIALEQQHDFTNAAVQLSHLYLDNKQFVKAQRAAAYAIKIEEKNIEALYLLASASYSLGDIQLALWAIEQARSFALRINAVHAWYLLSMRQQDYTTKPRLFYKISQTHLVS
jgi:Tfp pilus assembly protein PilF